jgi:hypothetical protein
MEEKMEPQEELNPTGTPPQTVKPAKPVLPALPEEMVSHKPSHTGICPGKAKLLMFLVALPISLVIGMAAHFVGTAAAYLGSWVALLPTLLTSVCGFVSWLFVLVGIAIVLGVFVGYPFLAGYLNGKLVATLGRKGFCRNPKIAGWAGLLNGIPLYLGHVIMSFLVAQQLAIMTFTPTQLESTFDIDMAIRGGAVLTYILCAIEFAFLLWGGFTGARDEVKDSTFCEEHQAWYGKWVEGRYPASVINPLAQRLTEQVYIQPVEQVKPQVFPALNVAYRCCPVGEGCEMEMKATLWWQQTSVDKNGQQKVDNLSELWFDMLVPSELGRGIVAELDLKPQDKKKKK